MGANIIKQNLSIVIYEKLILHKKLLFYREVVLAIVWDSIALDSLFFEKTIIRGPRFTHLRHNSSKLTNSASLKVAVEPEVEPEPEVPGKSIHSCAICGGEFLDEAMIESHHCTRQAPPKKFQNRPRLIGQIY